MAGFCGNCGFPLGANGTFCPQCGARHGTESTPVSPQPLPAPAAGSGLKILLIMLVCLGMAGAAVIGGIWYAAHRVKEAVVQRAKENGVDLGSIVPPARTSSNQHRVHKACELLSKEEAARMLGEPIEHTEYQDSECLYYGPPGLSRKLAQERFSDEFKRGQTLGSEVRPTELATAAEQLASNFGAAAGQAGSGGEMPLLMLSVEEDGKGAMTALNMTEALASGIAHAADPEGKAPRVVGQIKGLGDQAVQLPKLGLHVMQGDTVIGLLAGPIPDADAKTIEIARLVLKRL